MNFELDRISEPIREELHTFEDYFRATVKSDVPLLSTIINYILRKKGKQMRPMFVFLAAKMNGEFNEKTYTAAASIELLHTATLVHDDVVDESYERRGSFSVNALWGNKLAVLVGDYILAKGMLLNVDNGNYRFLQLISQSVKAMSEGEILQMKKKPEPGDQLRYLFRDHPEKNGIPDRDQPGYWRCISKCRGPSDRSVVPDRTQCRDRLSDQGRHFRLSAKGDFRKTHRQ